MKKNSRKRYIIIVTLCTLIVILAYSTITGVYLNNVLNKYQNDAEETISKYADKLKSVDITVIKNITTNKDSLGIYRDIVDPRISVILYEKRIMDDTGKYNTLDAFLNVNRVGLKGILNEASIENIAGTDYMIYEFSAGENYYVKLAMPYIDTHKYYVDFSISLVVFIIIAALICGIVIFIYDKFILENIKKQQEFVNDMSHEIRTPLTIIKGNLENSLAVPNSTIMDVAENIESSIREVDHLTSLSQNLLNIVSTTRTAVNKKKTYNLSEMISDVLDVYSDIISGSEKTLIANIDSIEAVVDSEKIKQLVIILLENAVKYTSKGDKIRVQLKRHEDAFELIVSDTGRGIDENDKEKIFERFYRGANAKSENGTGLGLSIAKEIVESHNGRISASNNIPNGLVISVYIPNKQE